MSHFYKYFIQEHKKKLIFYIFITLLNVFLEVLGLAAFFLMIGYLLNTNINLAILDIFKITDEYFLTLIILILFIYSVKIFFQILCIFFQKKIVIELQESLFLKLLKKYLFLSYEESSKDNSAIKLRYLTSETKKAVMYISGYLNIFTESIYVFGILAFLLFNYFALSLSVVLVLLFFGIFYYIIFRKRITDYAKSKILNDNELYNKIVQSINGLNEIKIYKLEKYFYDNIKKFQKRINKLNLLISLISSVPRYYFEIIILAIIVFTILILKSILGYQNNEIAELLAMMSLCLLRSFPSFTKILGGFQEINHSKPSAILISDQLKNFEKINFNKDIENYSEEYNFRNIELKNIYFKFAEKNKNILEDINIKINKGEIIGLYGETGSGKTTLINLISGLVKPTEGNIYFNHKVIDEMPKNLFSIVAQRPLIIDDTIRSNVAFGLDQNQVIEKEINNVLQKSELKKFTEELPEGVDTRISEGGKNISGGQIQRLAIARSIYLKKQILILDEATNALDEITEKNIIKFILSLKNELTVIIISHNKENLVHCDKVFEIKNKKIIKKKDNEKSIDFK